MRSFLAAAALLLSVSPSVALIGSPRCRLYTRYRADVPVRLFAKGDDSKSSDGKAVDLKAELTAYLQKRKELNADAEARAEIGKVIGGTKKNPILEYVSGAPNKPTVVEEMPNIFDYDQLTKYGFGHLVTPIMNAGGRSEMYKLMDMEPPPIPDRVKPKSAPKLIIDRTGETDKNRYTGLKMGQVLDDEAMGKALEEAFKKKQRGDRLRPKLVEEDYVMPFADKRNTGPRMTPDWTPEKLDEEGRKRGKAIAWAKKAKAGEFVKDPSESLTIEGGLRIYSVMVALFVSFAFGRSTEYFLNQMLGMGDSLKGVEDLLQAPALALLVASIGSSVISAVVLAPEKNRNRFVWGVKGLFGGPVAVAELRGLEALQTQQEKDQQESKPL